MSLRCLKLRQPRSKECCLLTSQMATTLQRHITERHMACDNEELRGHGHNYNSATA